MLQQFLYPPGLDGGQVGLDLFNRPVPPPQLEQCVNDRGVKALSDGAGGDTAHNGIGRDVLGDDGAGADNGAVPDGNAGQDDRFIPQPDVVAHDDVPLRSHAWVMSFTSSPHSSKKMGKG